MKSLMKNLMDRRQTFTHVLGRLAVIVICVALIATTVLSLSTYLTGCGDSGGVDTTAVPSQAARALYVPLSTAESFAVLAGTTATNTGPTVITGDLGVSPGSAVTGFPPGLVTGGTIHTADAVALQAQTDTTTAYNNLDQPCDFDLSGQDLGGMTLVPGVYCFSTSAGLTGALTLDGGGDPNAVWVFKTGSTLITATDSSVLLINSAQQCNVFWRIGSSATLGTRTTFVGKIIALQSITLTTGAKVSGSVLARNGAVTMDSNTIAVSVCAIPPVTPIPPTLGKAFSPATIPVGGVSTLTITLSNADATAATLNAAPFIDTLPSGVVIAAIPNAGTTCVGGTVTVGISTVTLTGGSIPANGSCTVTTDVTAPSGGIYLNSLAAGSLQTTNGSNAAPAVATLTAFQAPAAPTLSKAFSPATIAAAGVSTLTITLSNPNASIATLSGALIDTLPPGVVIAFPTNASTTCSGSGGVDATIGGTTVTLQTPSSIPANGSCTVTVNVTALVGGSYFNSLAAGALQTSNGTNAAPVVATLTVLPVIVPTHGLSLTKTPNPTDYTHAGQVIVYTYVVHNTGNETLTGPFTVIDDKLGSFVCGTATSLAPGASVTCTRSYTIQAGDLGNVTSLPTGVTAIIYTGPWLQGKTSTQNTTVSGADLLVPNGIYPGWCIEDYVINDLHNQQATLYSTIGGGLPADVAGLPWNKVNYVLNHKIRGAHKTNLEFIEDVQTAIWVLLGEPNPEFGVSATAQQMIDEANANPSFVPGPGDIVAVIVYSDGMHPTRNSIQESIIEVKPLQAIVNHATVSGTVGDVVVQSGQVQATVIQTLASKPGLSKSFSPATIKAGGVSTLTITLSNSNSTVANLTASLTDALPSGMLIAATGSNTCSGTLKAIKGTSKVILTGGWIPANGDCKVTVNVTAKYKGSYLNKLPAGALKTDQGSNATKAAATLTVNAR